MKSEKPFVYDEPVVITQHFRVHLPDRKGRVFVTRKEIRRQAHNTACDVADTKIDYEVLAEVDLETRNRAIEEVEKELKK